MGPRLHDGTHPGRERAKLSARLKAIDAEVANLTKAIATTGRELSSLVEALQDRERERTRIAVELAQLDVLDGTRTLTAKAIEDDLKTALVDWQGLLRANVQQARQAIRKLLAGRLIVTPSEEYTVFTISGTRLIEPLLDQTLRVPKAVVTPAGFEPAISTLKGLRPGPG